ncbi:MULTISPECIES: dolichyl-phosphate beta-glucosyltransferase [unclassified Methanoculleus]|jgi:glycosyltransferase involved in cell wall biosynthesis|uniref:Glycosyltransferase family 2 protein n=1 Tax=Methanoculleus palmolei TaxID=72612 RepID=A0ABD8A8R4_9EURY|nr:dolichyl-phosphate beta-glucosyltransferase [Methanoculleus sp. UBA377]MDD2473935.1 glycosyltransferase family 2 protein [Methanoculleus sp.]WOX55427.1 glycosyltransferase family 2 protein [Methanoculleus palmolei]
MREIEVSAVLPVYNDLTALKTAIPRSLEALESIAPERFELIVAEDGSTDGSAEFVRAYETNDPRVRLLHSDERLGRGRALNRAFSGANGSIVCYYDVDLATDMQHLAELVGAVRDGYDAATGSRLLPESVITRSGGREIASRGYNMLVRTILGSSLHDHQCGFKAFRRDRLLDLLPSVTAGHWFWDTEVLIRAQKNEYRIKELPVRWRQGEGTTVRRKDVVEMGSAILRLWWRLHVEKG